jgi:FlgD Ig-like domain/Cohesin domain
MRSFVRWCIPVVIALVASLAFTPAHAANPVTPQPPATCINLAHPCVTVPVTIHRTDSTPIRGYSVTIQLSPELALCTVASPITSGGMLPNAQFEVTDNGGGSYTVDEVTLGLPCGSSVDGTLFSIQLKGVVPTGTGSVTASSVILRDCSNLVIPTSAGPAATVPVDQVAPSPVALSATQKKSGNSATPAGTTDILVSWTGQEGGSSVAVYRKGFGGYPQYDENGGVAPATPATPAAAISAGWQLTGVTTSGGADRNATRDFWYYVAFVTDACGNPSVASNRTNGTLDYHLGDVHDGVTNCAGDDAVDTRDVSFLGAHYGITVPLNGAFECLDVGPTTDFSVDGRPTTDNKVQFEDLILFGINYGQVSMPERLARVVPATVDELGLDTSARPAVGELWSVPVTFAGTGVIKGVSVQLAWDPAVLDFVDAQPGGLLASQAAPGVVLSAAPGNVDVVALGTGTTLAGSGPLAIARFRVRSGGDPSLRVDRVIARDASNHEAAMGVSADAMTRPPQETALTRLYPNPVSGAMTVEMSLARSTRVQLAVFDLAGRRVRTLADGDYAAGVRTAYWDGRGEDGRPAANGFYVVRMRAGDAVRNRTIRVLH